jgi:carbonic anhydrase/acetyltransferase-like protein (isoleucine patch superfamily)
MIISYEANTPSVDDDAWVAQDATVSGDVVIGAGTRIMHGARVVAEAGGSIRIGRNCIVLENAVIRATANHPCRIGDHCVVGPNSHVVGAEISNEVFIATGASIFHGAYVGQRSQVRINGIVHLRTRLEPGTIVPIAWVAIGDPAQILSADRHEEIGPQLQVLDFPGFVYGVDRTAPGAMPKITKRLSAALGVHRSEAKTPDSDT